MDAHGGHHRLQLRGDRRGPLAAGFTTNLWTLGQQFTIRETLGRRWDRQHEAALEAAGGDPSKAFGSGDKGPGFFGSIMAIGGFIGAVQTESFATSLALESGLAWLVMLGGIAVAASALLIPRYVSRTTDVRTY